jgi:CDGSH-type Zn-finger protein
MNNPIIADIKPIKVSLKQSNKYLYCTCGRSKNQPFCDGSHEGTDFLPKLIDPKENEEVYLCMCKHSKSLPYCDGTHEKFSDKDIGTKGLRIKSN